MDDLKHAWIMALLFQSYSHSIFPIFKKKMSILTEEEEYKGWKRVGKQEGRNHA